MSPEAVVGEQIFRGKAGCVACHLGPFFTDGLVHDILVPQVSGGNDPGSPLLANAFNTPSLRDVSATGPYMHNGIFTSLAEVVDFYVNRSILAPLRLHEDEKAALVAYLESL